MKPVRKAVSANLKKIFLIEVTADDIRLGHKASCVHCPVALACMRCKGSTTVFVSPVGITTYAPSGHKDIYSTPASVKSFIKKFDKGRLVTPFKFELEDKT